MATVTETQAPAKAVRERIDSLDLLRGFVMVIMALDHVRDYFHNGAQHFSPENLTQTTGPLFFTRWITHFCAPVFVFLAGTGVHFASSRRASPSVMSRFLLTRGLWLVFLELTVANVAFSFNFSYRFVLFQVLWALGWSMIALAALIRLKRQLILAIALAMILLHNAFDNVTPAALGAGGWLWSILHVPTFYSVGSRTFMFLYPLIPWIGVMAAGYCFGPVMQVAAEQRRKTLLRLGGVTTAAFFLLRWINVYGDPQKWSVQNNFTMTIISFFKATKYPPSLLYLLMTLGPALIALAALDGIQVKPNNFFRVFGRVPMFYYLLHWYALHALMVVLGGLRFGQWRLFFTFPTGPLGMPSEYPPSYGYSLPIVYLIWILLVVALYFPCHWYMNYKNRNHAAWLSYL